MHDKSAKFIVQEWRYDPAYGRPPPAGLPADLRDGRGRRRDETPPTERDRRVDLVHLHMSGTSDSGPEGQVFGVLAAAIVRVVRFALWSDNDD
jgi:hypothetical protein